MAKRVQGRRSTQPGQEEGASNNSVVVGRSCCALGGCSHWEAHPIIMGGVERSERGPVEGGAGAVRKSLCMVGSGPAGLGAARGVPRRKAGGRRWFGLSAGQGPSQVDTHMRSSDADVPAAGKFGHRAPSDMEVRSRPCSRAASISACSASPSKGSLRRRLNHSHQGEPAAPASHRRPSERTVRP